MKLRRYALAAIFLVAMAAGPTYGASQDAEDTFTMGDIVVSGEKGSVADIGISQVITDVEIKATNSTTLAEALKFAPGIVVTRGMKNEPQISIHGFSTEKTLFLIDGIPYYETYYGKLNLDQIPVGMISKIEITKNAPSVLYGANAQIAVVNVVTKKGTQDPSLSFQGEVGEHNTYSASLSHGNQVGAVNYWLSYLHKESDGWRMSRDFEPKTAKRRGRAPSGMSPEEFYKFDGIQEDGGLRENSDYTNDSLWARVGITPTPDSEYFASFHIMDSEKGNPNSIYNYQINERRGDNAAFTSFRRFETYRDWGVDLNGKQVISSALTLRGKLFYHNHSDLYVFHDGPNYANVLAKSEYKDNFLGTSLFADFQFVDMHKGHFSLHYKRDTHEDRDDEYLPFNKYQADTGSIGTEHEFFTDFGLTLYAGAAYDWLDFKKAEGSIFEKPSYSLQRVTKETPSTTGEFNPMAGFTWEKEQLKVYGSVAKKSRFPTLRQLYSTSSGNPDLTSEQSINYTLGVTKMFGERVTADVSGFHHDISDWISRDYVNDKFRDDYDTYTNVEDVSMLGFETSLNVEFCDYFSMNANYTYNRAKNKSDNRVTDKVSGVPENKYGLGCALLIPKVLVKVDLQAIFVDNIYRDLPTTKNPDNLITENEDYFIVNTRISKKFRDNMSFYVALDNLFDEDYEQEIGFPGEGRNFRVGFTLDL